MSIDFGSPSFKIKPPTSGIMNRITKITVFLILSMFCAVASAQTYRQVNDISYTQKRDAYSIERLKLDVYHPEDKTDCPVIVWFHGGGLEGGNKEIPASLKEKGLVVVGVNYRLLPQVTVKETLDDAAEAVAWVFKHISEYGGDTRKIVVSGHSAGGYISMMLCLDKSWLAAYSVDADNVMKYAPLYWVRGDCPPMVLICGDRELELYGRYDENQYFARMMKLAGHQQTYLYEIDGHGHNGMVEPGFHILETHLKQMLGQPVMP